MNFIILGKCTSDDTNWSCCSTDHKCGIGKGDCDKDADCEAGLKCGHDKFCSNDFPSKWYDCCYNPGKLVHRIVLNLFLSLATTAFGPGVNCSFDHFVEDSKSLEISCDVTYFFAFRA